MKTILPAAALLSALLATPAWSASQVSSSASVRQLDGASEAAVRGQVGIAVMNGDKLELKDRIVYVNGEPFGKVPKICEVKFIVSGADRKLYVDGKFRADVPAGTRR